MEMIGDNGRLKGFKMDSVVVRSPPSIRMEGGVKSSNPSSGLSPVDIHPAFALYLGQKHLPND